MNSEWTTFLPGHVRNVGQPLRSMLFAFVIRQMLRVRVTEERVCVERRIVDRPVTAGAGAFEEMIIEAPLTTETVDVQKQARVTGEVAVSREAVQRTEQVSGTVLREEFFVD